MEPLAKLQQYLNPPSIRTIMQYSGWLRVISPLLSNWFCKKPPFSQTHNRVQDVLILLLLLLLDKLYSISSQQYYANRLSITYSLIQPFPLLLRLVSFHMLFRSGLPSMLR